jgi:hypothetical protein
MSDESIAAAIETDRAGEVVPDLCRRALAELADGRRDLAAVRHPLGFVCLPLERDPEYGVCVHVWAPDLVRAEATTSTVHSHSWDLVSLVLYGQVVNSLSEVTEDVTNGTHRVFEVHSTGPADEIRATERRVRHRPAEQQPVGAGQVYRLPAGRFHTTRIDGDRRAATVVLGRAREQADLSLGALDTPSHRVVRQRCDREETRSVARMVIAELALRDGVAR